MLDKDVVLVGYSGHGQVVVEAALESNLKVNYYTEIEPVKYNLFDLEYLGFEGNPAFSGWADKDNFVLGIGDNKIRQKTADIILARGKNILNVLHPSSSLSGTIKMGSGNFFAKHASIALLVTIGNNCILNTGCIVDHECSIGNSVHLAPGAVLAGNVKIGDRSFVGANSVIKQGVQIGENVTIGAGAVVLSDVPDGLTMVGNPARKL